MEHFSEPQISKFQKKTKQLSSEEFVEKFRKLLLNSIYFKLFVLSIVINSFQEEN